MSYVVDTSALIAAWSERYPTKRVPNFWKEMDGLIDSRRVVSPEDVRREIKEKSDGLGEWLNGRRNMFIELDGDIQKQASAVLLQFPWLAKAIRSRNSADVFVIALAKTRGLTVITEEGYGSEAKPRIPRVCDHFRVPCINLIGLLDAEDWIL